MTRMGGKRSCSCKASGLLFRTFLALSQGLLRLRRLNGDMPEPSRVEAGRKRAQTAKRTVTVAAAAGFAVALALVRQGHPATVSSSTTRTHSQSQSSFSPSSDDDRERSSTRGSTLYGGGSIAPSSSVTPPVATSTS